MKTRFLLLLGLLCYYSGSAQISTAHLDNMNHIFQVNRSYVTTGILWDYGVNFVPVLNYGGTVNLTNHTSLDNVQALHASLFSMGFNANANSLTTPAAFNQAIEDPRAKV